MNTEKERVINKEDLKQSLIWHSNLSYEQFLRDQVGYGLGMAWSENSCGKWHFFGLKERQDFENLAAQPNKNS